MGKGHISLFSTFVISSPFCVYQKLFMCHYYIFQKDSTAETQCLDSLFPKGVWNFFIKKPVGHQFLAGLKKFYNQFKSCGMSILQCVFKIELERDVAQQELALGIFKAIFLRLCKVSQLKNRKQEGKQFTGENFAESFKKFFP